MNFGAAAVFGAGRAWAVAPPGTAANAAVKAAAMSPQAGSAQEISSKFTLLPAKDASDPFHKVPVLFQRIVSKKTPAELPDTSLLPAIPEHFVGREVDMYEILESLL